MATAMMQSAVPLCLSPTTTPSLALVGLYPFFLIHLQPWVCLCYNTKCIRHGSHCLRGSLAAWRSHGTSNATLISNLRSNGLITTDRVYKAMLNVDRANYVLNKQRAYEDCPQSISYGATISAPHVRSSLILIA